MASAARPTSQRTPAPDAGTHRRSSGASWVAVRSSSDAFRDATGEPVDVAQRQVHLGELVVEPGGLLRGRQRPRAPGGVACEAIHLKRAVGDAGVRQGESGVLRERLLVERDGALDVLRILPPAHRVAALEIQLVRLEVLGRMRDGPGPLVTAGREIQRCDKLRRKSRSSSVRRSSARPRYWRFHTALAGGDVVEADVNLKTIVDGLASVPETMKLTPSSRPIRSIDPDCKRAGAFHRAARGEARPGSAERASPRAPHVVRPRRARASRRHLSPQMGAAPYG